MRFCIDIISEILPINSWSVSHFEKFKSSMRKAFDTALFKKNLSANYRIFIASSRVIFLVDDVAYGANDFIKGPKVTADQKAISAFKDKYQHQSIETLALNGAEYFICKAIQSPQHKIHTIEECVLFMLQNSQFQDFCYDQEFRGVNVRWPRKIIHTMLIVDGKGKSESKIFDNHTINNIYDKAKCVIAFDKGAIEDQYEQQLGLILNHEQRFEVICNKLASLKITLTKDESNMLFILCCMLEKPALISFDIDIKHDDNINQYISKICINNNLIKKDLYYTVCENNNLKAESNLLKWNGFKIGIERKILDLMAAIAIDNDIKYTDQEIEQKMANYIFIENITIQDKINIMKNVVSQECKNQIQLYAVGKTMEIYRQFPYLEKEATLFYHDLRGIDALENIHTDNIYNNVEFIDGIISIFMLLTSGKSYSGSKDPYGMKRYAGKVRRILEEHPRKAYRLDDIVEKIFLNEKNLQILTGLVGGKENVKDICNKIIAIIMVPYQEFKGFLSPLFSNKMAIIKKDEAFAGMVSSIVKRLKYFIKKTSHSKDTTEQTIDLANCNPYEVDLMTKITDVKKTQIQAIDLRNVINDSTVHEIKDAYIKLVDAFNNMLDNVLVEDKQGIEQRTIIIEDGYRLLIDMYNE